MRRAFPGQARHGVVYSSRDMKNSSPTRKQNGVRSEEKSGGMEPRESFSEASALSWTAAGSRRPLRRQRRLAGRGRQADLLVRPKDAKKYRVIYADLSVREADTPPSVPNAQPVPASPAQTYEAKKREPQITRMNTDSEPPATNTLVSVSVFIGVHPWFPCSSIRPRDFAALQRGLEFPGRHTPRD